MSGSTLLYVGLGAIGSSVMVAALAFVGDSAERVGVSRSLETIERSYGSKADRLLAQQHSGPEGSLKDRIGVPLARKLGGIGQALTQEGARIRLERHLDYAGNPGAWPVERVITAKGVALVVGGVGGLLFGLMLGSAMKVVLCGIIGTLVGFFGPDLLLYNAGSKRQGELRKSLPDVLDTLTICVEAGQGFDAALAQVSRNGKGPITGEMARVLQEMRIGKSRVEAMRSLAARTTVEEFKGFASAVVQASDLGVPIASVLREQAKEMRTRRRQRAEEAAQKVPIKILFPTLFFLFPALFVVIIGPAILGMLGRM